MNSKTERRLNIGLRLPENIINKADERAKELNINRTDIVEKALRCYLGITFDTDCANQTELTKLTELVQTLITVNNLKTDV